jgi:hypothetical protein
MHEPVMPASTSPAVNFQLGDTGGFTDKYLRSMSAPSSASTAKPSRLIAMVFAGASRRGCCEKSSIFDSLGKAALGLPILGFTDACCYTPDVIFRFAQVISSF